MLSANTQGSGFEKAAFAIRQALLHPEGNVTPAVETQVQNALFALRSGPHDRALLSWLEEIAISLRVLAQAKREGRSNFYMSRLLRLRRHVFH